MSTIEPFERRLEITKILQGKEMRTGDIAEYFGVDERTIRGDLDALRKGLDVFGVKIKIESKHNEGNPKQYYKSTVHPIMLALNLTELFHLLKLLEEAGKNRITGQIYKNIFNDIYSQITDYAENLISKKLNGTYDKSQVANRLEEDIYNNDFGNTIAYLYKSGQPCDISYTNFNGEIINEQVHIVDIQGDKVKVRYENGNLRCYDYNDLLIDLNMDLTNMTYK